MAVKAVWLVALSAVCVSAISAQTPVRYTRDLCVKVQPGKGPEYAAMLHDVSAKLAQVRVDEGKLGWWLAERAVVPAGTAARCDYHLVSFYEGFPPEPPTPADNEAAYKKAKINMTSADMSAKLTALTTLVNIDIWRGVAAVGRPDKGSYVRMNLYKANPGQAAEWAKLETEGWKPMVEAYAKENPGFGWAAAALAMPAGTSLHYNAMTVDVFPKWAAVGTGIPVTTEWPKVHADLPFADYMGRVNKTVDRYRVEVYQIVEMVRGK